MPDIGVPSHNATLCMLGFLCPRHVCRCRSAAVVTYLLTYLPIGLLGVRFRAPARRGPPGGRRARAVPAHLRALRPPSGFKRLHASERQHLRKRRKSFRIQPAERPRHRRPRAGGAPRDRTFEPHLQSSLPPRHCAGGATPPHAPPARPSRRPRGRAAPPARAAPARWLRGASLGRLGGPRLCVCVDRGAGSDCARARTRYPRRRPRRGERGRTRAEAAGPVSYFQPARALGDFRVGYHTA